MYTADVLQGAINRIRFVQNPADNLSIGTR